MNAVTIFLLGIVGIVLGVAFSTWVLMLVLGWVSTFLVFVPALSFFQTLGVVVLLWLVGWALSLGRVGA